MDSNQHPLLINFAKLYFSIKQFYYQLRYPNLTLEPGVLIKGKLTISGNVKVKIGAGTRIRMNVKIYGSGDVTIGRDTLLNGCWIGCVRSIKIGDRCLISDCFLQDSDYHNLEPHLRFAPPGSKTSAPIVIENNVWVGARATIMKGVHISQDSVIGLGSIIRKSVPPGVVVIGNPQQIVKHLYQDADKKVDLSPV
ncbi:acyltransferase [Tolypothrix sp. FACHB-123]|uniref:acyltransferase n=1 Tax=Tolypothrix sp. FACHB-123 TaxID=2692868 RepID=UPI001682ABD9|nr:acyltransferase [Tolypothrix sp. FACHB-123]MBD2358956.1 acyltransferase [Tolypothrix sp. FACHB-123]